MVVAEVESLLPLGSTESVSDGMRTVKDAILCTLQAAD
jgi:hypothetical protein